MNKKNILLSTIVLLAIIIFVAFYTKNNKDEPAEVTGDYKNISYTIENQIVSLKNGISESNISTGSQAKTTTKYFGNEIKGDFNNDGKGDVAFLLTQNNGGSGTFYYVVVALKTKNGYTGTNGFLLGDRIAPQTTEFSNGDIIVNYADRGLDEPMTAQPSIGVSRYFKIEGNKLIEDLQ